MPETPILDERYVDPFKLPSKATCSFCKKETNILLASCMNLKVGDAVYRDPENVSFGRCPQCMRYKLVVSFVPTFTEEPVATGFWKMPVEEDSSGTEIDSSGEQCVCDVNHFESP
jgi:uncharacterized protein (DUF2249 family)